MKKNVFSSIVFLLMIICFSANMLQAQGVYQLWGTTTRGGNDNKGVIYSTRYDGSGYAIKKQFTVTNPGDVDYFNKPLVYNNKFYCMMGKGGLSDNGIIAEFNPVTGAWVRKADFYNIGGWAGEGYMTLYNNKFYGVAHGGNNNVGIIFEFNPANGQLLKIHDFTPALGSYPNMSLTVYNNKFYGVTSSGGANDEGVLFEYNPATDIYTKKVDFLEATTGRNYWGSTLLVYSNKLWGAHSHGGINGAGTFYSYDPALNQFSKKADFNSIGLENVMGSLTLLNNKIYGMTLNGGVNGWGGIFEYNPAVNSLTKEKDLSYGAARYRMDFTVYNNKLYGCGVIGGTNNLGQICSYDPASNVFTPLYNMDSFCCKGTGAITLYNNKLWGFHSDGGQYNSGGMFSFNPANLAFDTVLQLGGPELTNPSGALTYYNNKFYGTADYGGLYYKPNSSGGGIYEYDPLTGVFNTKINLDNQLGKFYDQGGFTVYNNKFYGVTRYGGNTNYGVLFEYDPLTNAYIKKHNFDQNTGSTPIGAPQVFNGKLYGTCINLAVGTNGNIYEFNLATNTYSQKVILDANKGAKPYGKMVLYNNKFYGLCFSAGANSAGTLYEYNPNFNGFTKKIDFDGANGSGPIGSLTVYNNKLYGTTIFGGSADSGTLFKYDPALNSLNKIADLNGNNGKMPCGTMTLINNKLIGTTYRGGLYDEGSIFQLDPLNDNYTKKMDMASPTGTYPRTQDLVSVPAPAAPGLPNSCLNTQNINITAANANEWIAFTDVQGRAVAEINANGNILGNTMVRFYVHNGAVRQDANNDFYLDRNITISPTNQPLTSVSLRLYIRKTEFDILAATAGAGVVVPSDLKIYRNGDFCSSDLTLVKTQIPATPSDWAGDYVYTCNSDTLASFYFGGNANVPLPVYLLSFTGTIDGPVNTLHWQANCSGNTSFIIERSNDAINFQSLEEVKAGKADCASPFNFADVQPPAGKGYYRLQMKDEDGAVKYSQVILLNRGQQTESTLLIVPNPVSGSSMSLQVYRKEKGTANIMVSDMSGRVLYNREVLLSEGSQTLMVPVQGWAPGVYSLLFAEGGEKSILRFSIQ